MRLIPVIDIQNGVVVRGIGGRRSEYRPIESCLTDSAEPFAVAQSLVNGFAPVEIYVADLDAIAGEPLAADSLRQLRQLSVKIWLDAGIRRLADVVPLVDSGIDGIVLGLETLHGPEVIDEIVAKFRADRFIFSLDLRGGRLLGDWRRWPALDERDWPTIVDRVAKSGIRRLVLLDLERVGEGRGVGTADMCRAIAAKHPDVEIICGGGIRNIDDLRDLEPCGAAGALVASALHDGRIKPGDWPIQPSPRHSQVAV